MTEEHMGEHSEERDEKLKDDLDRNEQEGSRSRGVVWQSIDRDLSSLRN